MDNDNKNLGEALIDLNLILTNKLEGFNFDTKHKTILLDTEFKILHLLENYGRLTPNELVDRLYIAKSNLSNQCKEMMKSGLISQFSNKIDKRVVCYELCQKGREKYYEVLDEIIKNFNVAIGDNFAEEKKELLIKIDSLLN